MRSMKLFPLAVLFVIMAALLAGTRAIAGNWSTTNLTCVVADSDPDHGASGVVKLTVEAIWWDTVTGWTVASGTVSVTCRGLTPGVTYTVVGRAFIPKQSGSGSVAGSFYFEGPGVDFFKVRVVREDETLVLAGRAY